LTNLATPLCKDKCSAVRATKQHLLSLYFAERCQARKRLVSITSIKQALTATFLGLMKALLMLSEGFFKPDAPF